MDLVKEEMREQIADALGDHAFVAPVRHDAAVEISSRQTIAKCDETTVELRLGAGEPGRVVDVGVLVKDAQAPAALLQGIEVEQVDREDVVERGLDRREEARPRRLELTGVERKDGAIEPVV